MLKSLANSLNPVADFRDLIKKYPEVIKVIPILIASRDGLLKVLTSLETGLIPKSFNFKQSKYTLKETNDIVSFAKNSGLLDTLCQMESATDYLLGVEVGLDTNARKNRSGTFLEKMVTETLKELTMKNPRLVYIEQKTFGYVKKTYGIEIPPSLTDRKFDYAVISEGKATTIEVNYYGGTGSKPSEIVSSYTNRSEVLKAAGWKFVWLTDGPGWKHMKRPLHIGIENIEYVINTKMLRDGLLEKVILEG